MNQPDKWREIKDPSQDVVHIMPIGDFEPHDESESCRCEPERREVEDGACDLLIHNAYDDSLNVAAGEQQ